MEESLITVEDIHDSWMVRNKEFNFPDEGNHQQESRVQILRQRWENAIENIPGIHIGTAVPNNVAIASVINSWFDKIITMHSEESRHYHSLCHLEEMFGYVDLAFGRTFPGNESSSSMISTSKTSWSAIVDLSIFFHDLVYNAKSASNEEDSAKLLLEFEAELTNLTKVDWWGFKTVQRFIMATKTHNVEDEDGADSDARMANAHLHLFLDADMSVLGKDPDAYDHYASLIRLEYIHVPHDMFCEKRAEILRSFIGSVKNDEGGGERKGEGSGNSTTGMKQKTVYLNSKMRDALEMRAIANLQREIESLDRGVIPS